MNSVQKMYAVLQQVEAYLADRSDVIDGDYGKPEANAEMVLLREVEEALAAAPAPQPVQGEADGYTSYGEFRWACDADERMRATWTPLWTAQPPAVGDGMCAKGQAFVDYAFVERRTGRRAHWLGRLPHNA